MNYFKEINSIQYRFNTITDYDLLAFYCKNDKAFVPSLSEQVNISDYVQKIKQNAVTFEAWNNSTIMGLIAGYFNDKLTNKAFITSVVVCPEYQGLGIASKLLEYVIEYAVNNNFESIGLEVYNTNEKALYVYKKFNFKIISQSINKVNMERINEP